MFLAFLQRENALKGFIYNRQNHSLTDCRLNSLFKNNDPQDYIWRGFDWKGTAQGLKYWRVLADKWDSFLKRVGKRIK